MLPRSNQNMNAKERGFLKGRLQSLGHALHGLRHLASGEHNFKIQLAISLGVTAAGWLVGLSRNEWMLQTLAIGLVLGAEAMNTALELLCNYVQPSRDQRIGLVKDIAAAGVTIAAIASAIVGLLIYIPKFL